MTLISDIVKINKNNKDLTQMKLYVNENRTKWAGTQADAKKELGKFEAHNVPTDKMGLLEFLNNFEMTPSVTLNAVEEDAGECASEKVSTLDKHAQYRQDYFSCELCNDRNDRHLTEGESGWDRPNEDDI